MTTPEFKRRAQALFGHGWMAKMSRGTGAGYQTVRRWAHGVTPPPPLACAVITLLETLVNHGHPLPPEYL